MKNLDLRTEKITIQEAKNVFAGVVKTFLDNEDLKNPSPYFVDIVRIFSISGTPEKIIKRLLETVKIAKERFKVNFSCVDSEKIENKEKFTNLALLGYFRSEIIQIKKELWKNKIELPSLSATEEKIKKMGVLGAEKIKSLIG